MAPISAVNVAIAPGPTGPFLTVMKSVQGDSEAVTVWPGEINNLRYSHEGKVITAQITRSGEEPGDYNGQISFDNMVPDRPYCNLPDYD